MSFGGFGKPATGFGGTTAPASSPFGQPAQPQQSGLFGSTSAAPAGGSSLFGLQQNANTGGSQLFGQQQQQQQQPQGSSLFGGQQNGSTSGGGLFGSQPNASSSTGGGLFGQQQQQQNTGSGLFGSQQGSTSTGGFFGQQQQQPQQQNTGGLFGQQQQQPQQQSSFGSFGQAKPATGLFGTASTNTATQPAGMGFLGQQQQQQPSGLNQSTNAGGGLFGQQSQQGGSFGQQNKSMFGQPGGGLQLGQSQQQQSSLFAKPQQAQSQNSGIGKTRFADLPENIQKGIEQLDAGIKDQKQIGASIDMTNIGRAIWQTSADVKAASDEQAAIAQGLYSLRASLEQLATRVNEQATDLQKLLETWEAAKPLERRSSNIRPLAHRDFPQEFFYRVAKSLEERVNRYRRNIMLLNRAIMGLANDNEALTPQIVAQTIQNNQSAIISLAAQLDQLQLRMNALRTEFTNDYREKTNSMRDPFEVAREEKGVSLLRA